MRLISLVALFFLASCASVGAGRVLLKLPAKPPGCDVKFVSVAPSGAREVGTLELSGTSPYAKDYTEQLQRETCALGGNAVLIPQLQQGYGGVVNATATVLELPKGP